MKRLPLLVSLVVFGVVLAGWWPTTARGVSGEIKIEARASNSAGDELEVEVVDATTPVGLCDAAGYAKFTDGGTGTITEVTLIRLSVPAAHSSVIGLHSTGSGCVGATADPDVIIDIADGPGVTVTWQPGTGDEVQFAHVNGDSVEVEIKVDTP